MNQALDELTAGDGPIFDHWLARLRASVGINTFGPSSARS
jgi:hypothetical protein